MTRIQVSFLKALTPLLFLLANDLLAHGIFRNGDDAQSMALGGIDTPEAGTPVSALQGNPAGLSFQDRNAVQASLSLGILDGDFSNSVNQNSPLNTGQGVIPSVGVRYQIEGMPITLGLGIAAESALEADWRYNDAPGGLGGTVSYGVQQNRSKFVAARLAAGASWEINEYVAVGAVGGMVYNDNQLTAPYTFQNSPGISGAKTLLDLKTTGIGWNGNFGIMVKPTEWLQLGVSYQTPTRMSTSGQADGNAYAQFAALSVAAPANFTYKANIQTSLPQIVSVGAKVSPVSWGRLFFQADWVDYANAFDDLVINLSNGTNATLNTLTGGNSFTETSPLNWQSVWVYRVGTEVDVLDNLRWRVGYTYGDNPVPTATITPLTAAINEQTIGTGVIYNMEDWELALTYQYDIKNTVNVNNSQILNGEYQGSSISLDGHWVAFSASYLF